MAAREMRILRAASPGEHVCLRCGGRPSRAARTRTVDGEGGSHVYLCYFWACIVCGSEWEDAFLEGLNASAARAAGAERHRHLIPGLASAADRYATPPPTR